MSTRRLAAIILVLATLLCSPRSGRAEVTSDQVKIAIDKAIAYIKSTQRGGGWQDMGRAGGMTALNLLALLNAGVPESDPVVRSGLEALKKAPTDQTYVTALKAMVYRYAGPEKYRKELQEAATWLIEAQLPNGTWGYNKMVARPNVNMTYVGDNSNTQFAILGLHEAALGGIKIPPEVWRRSEEHFLKTQLPDGGWHYRHMAGRAATGYGSMTAAGVASLYITGNQLNVSQESGYINGVAPRCGQYRQNEAIAAGMLWMARNFAVDTHPGRGSPAWRLYYLYAMERVGMVSGVKFFGSHDWYRQGAEMLVNSQQANGSFAGPAHDTAFALLFLAKGNKPVLFNKLQWGQSDEWCQDRNDIEHLVQFVNSAKHKDAAFTSEPLGWQVVNLRARLVDLLDAPIMYFNGHVFPKFTQAERDKLREYVDQGGTIFAEACCSRKEFIDGFAEFARKTWPEYPVDRLGDDHPVFSSFYPINKNEWELAGIQVGCRTGMIFAARDMSCLWEQNDPNLPLTTAAFQIGTNIAAYATGLERLKDKLERARVADGQAGPARPGDIVRGALHIGVLAHNQRDSENMPDPNALPKFHEYLRDQAKIDVVTKLQIIQPNDPELLNHPMMYMTGHNGFKYSDEQLRAIRTWLDRGGFLYADACCGRDAAVHDLPGDAKLTNDFGTSFRQMVAELYKDEPNVMLQPLPREHPIRGTAKGFFPLNQVTYRAEFEKKLQAHRPAAVNELVLEGVTVKGRLAIVYSPFAITCGLEDHKCFNCRGLISRDAYRVSTNVMLYVLSH